MNQSRPWKCQEHRKSDNSMELIDPVDSGNDIRSPAPGRHHALRLFGQQQHLCAIEAKGRYADAGESEDQLEINQHPDKDIACIARRAHARVAEAALYEVGHPDATYGAEDSVCEHREQLFGFGRDVERMINGRGSQQAEQGTEEQEQDADVKLVVGLSEILAAGQFCSFLVALVIDLQIEASGTAEY
ncbi:MAG: hypothetical protein ACU843_17155 [Gammaproteobacteria bacterium]